MNPILIAGPLLRRVTTDVVCVWLATQEEVAVELEILLGHDCIGKAVYQPAQTGAEASPTPSEEITLCRLGKQLFVYLLQARPEPTVAYYPRDTLLHYRLRINGSPFDFQAQQLTYARAEYPSFFIPSQLQHFLHGSCRKPHGNSQDALSFADDELARTAEDLQHRPALLLLTGDQIYADDVADAILDLLTRKATQHLGYEEVIFPDAQLAISTQQGNQTTLTSRQALVKKQAGFTSSAAKNHLLTFGEYAAMYLYVLGNADQWQPDFSLETNPTIQANLHAFHDSLPKVRRLLANTPTYMIFDDHDVTDDWNITGAWYDKVRDLSLGRKVVSNALAAYWAFQGWGNAPDNFDPDILKAISDYFNAAPSQSPRLVEHFELSLWKHRGWGYSIPSNPPIIAIDSRTQRQPDGDYYPPQLLDRYALDWLRMEWAKLMARVGEDVENNLAEAPPAWPIFVATTPVMGLVLIEKPIRFLLWLVSAIEGTWFMKLIEKPLGLAGWLSNWLINKLDAEAWISNYDGFSKFLNQLCNKMQITQCVFLSGDVHYSFTTEARFDSGGKSLHCLQLTSSSLCNEPSASNHFDQINQLIHDEGGQFKNPNMLFRLPTLFGLGWQVTGRYLLKAGSDLDRITPECNIGLVTFQDGRPVKHSLLTAEKNRGVCVDSGLIAQQKTPQHLLP